MSASVINLTSKDNSAILTGASGPQSWPVPKGTFRVNVYMAGGGGGGEGGTTGGNAKGGHGAQPIVATYVTTAGGSVSYEIGAGGSGGTGGAPGVNGGDTTFGTLTAKGGWGGNHASLPSVIGPNIDYKFATLMSVGGGGIGPTAGNDSIYASGGTTNFGPDTPSGAGGGAGFGAGGHGGTNFDPGTGENGYPGGISAGGGGGGASTAGTLGGTGGDGIIIITW